MNKIYAIYLSIFLLFSGQLFAQWKFAGPDNIGSKTRAIVVDPHNPNRVIAGSVGGGLWVSEDQGSSWHQVTTYAAEKCNPNVTCIAIRGDKMYVGTGETGLITTYRNVTEFLDYNVSNDSAGYYLGYIGNPGGGVYVGNYNSTTGEWVFDANSNVNGTTQAPFGANTSDYRGPFMGVYKILAPANSSRTYIGTQSGLFYSDSLDLSVIDTASIQLDTTIVYKRSFPYVPTFGKGKILDIEMGPNGKVMIGLTANDKAGSRGSGWMAREMGTDPLDPNNVRPLFAAADSMIIKNVDGTYKKSKLSFVRTEIAVSRSDNNVMYVGGTTGLGEIYGVWRYLGEEAVTRILNGQTVNTPVPVYKTYAPQGSTGFTPLALKEKNYHAFVLDVIPSGPENVILAGNAWYNYSADNGWITTAQSSNPNSTKFVPNAVYTVAFHPTNDSIFYVGTDKQIVRTLDGGKTFSQKSKGYESATCTSVASMNVSYTADTSIHYTSIQDSLVRSSMNEVFTGTTGNGLQVNAFYYMDDLNAYDSTNYFGHQGFGRVTANNYSDVQVSYLYPYSVVSQHSDHGLIRSQNYGASWETFYGFPAGFPDTVKLTGITASSSDSVYIDRTSRTGAGSGLQGTTTSFGFYIPNQAQWVIDEVIPDSMLNKGAAELQKLKNYIFFTNGKALWQIENALGDPSGPAPTWTRLTNTMVSAPDGFTAIAVSGDTTHNVFIGTSNGQLWRIKRAHDRKGINAKTTDASTTSIAIHNKANTGLNKGRSISSIAVNPANPKQVVVTYAGYGKRESMNKNKLILMTNDITATTPIFTPIGATLPEKMPIYCSQFVLDQNGSAILMIGTEKGLYATTDLQNVNFVQQLPEVAHVPVTDISVRKYRANMSNVIKKEFTLEKDNTVFVATNGKGIYYTSAYAAPRLVNPPVTTTLPTNVDVRLYPNPTAEKYFALSVELPESAEVQVSLVTVDGKEVFHTEAISLDAGMEKITFPTDRLSTGIYYVKVNIKGATLNESNSYKLMIAK